MAEPRHCPCPYCDLDDPTRPEPVGGWILRDEHWLVGQGDPDTTMAGGVRITSRRHYVDFADMDIEEATSFGLLVTVLDRALRAATGAERVHVLSTRDRLQHFHAWLYPRPATHPLRGTEFLNAPQHSLTEDAERTVHAVRDRLQVSTPAFPEPDAVSGDLPGRR
ncbi:HIT family protein [Sphaerimonospora mesophila]|uniref:HIT family protein n=1 Tax=Sphaerimonospora mesophila TaxID=37483 RepID=UPI0006E3A6AA